jgi:hypothetical protein
MPYNINRYNGTLVSVVEDGTVDNTLDIKLIGKNYAGYGEVQNENFVHLLENFAGTSEPTRKISGQIWYDSGTKKLKFYDGTKFRTTGGAEIGASEPVGLTTGDFWYNTNTNQLYAWSGSEFILVGPQAVANAETTQLRSRSVVDTTSATHAIVEAVVNGVVVYIISSDEFTLNAAINPITGYSVIKKGITLVNTPSVTLGPDVEGVTSTDHRFWGTSSNALKLGGVDATKFVRNDISSLPTVAIRFSDLGFTVGNDDDLSVFIDGTTPTIQNVLSDTIVFKTNTGTVQTPLKIIGANTLPGSNNVSNLGSSSFKFATVFATSFNGVATQADTLNLGGSYVSASLTATPSTIAARDSSGDIYANRFEGTAAEAEYADLAEKYLTDADYDVGTVVTVGGEAEVRAAIFGDRAIGVISAHPAYLMNSASNGQAVALKGRVPVKVTGAIKKGDRLIAADNGCAVHAGFHQYQDVFAIALETNNDVGIKLVEAIVL